MSEPTSPTPPPAYTMEQLRGFREAFAPQAARYRQNQPKRLLANLLGLVGIMWGWRLSEGTNNFGPPLGFVSLAIVIFVIGHRLRPKLMCPACQRAINLLEIGPCCPVCGSRQGLATHWWRGTSCKGCGQVFGGKKGSVNWKVHACTHCGVRLDSAGLDPSLLY